MIAYQDMNNRKSLSEQVGVKSNVCYLPCVPPPCTAITQFLPIDEMTWIISHFLFLLSVIPVSVKNLSRLKRFGAIRYAKIHFGTKALDTSHVVDDFITVDELAQLKI